MAGADGSVVCAHLHVDVRRHMYEVADTRPLRPKRAHGGLPLTHARAVPNAASLRDWLVDEEGRERAAAARKLPPRRLLD